MLNHPGSQSRLFQVSTFESHVSRTGAQPGEPMSTADHHPGNPTPTRPGPLRRVSFLFRVSSLKSPVASPRRLVVGYVSFDSRLVVGWWSVTCRLVVDWWSVMCRFLQATFGLTPCQSSTPSSKTTPNTFLRTRDKGEKVTATLSHTSATAPTASPLMPATPTPASTPSAASSTKNRSQPATST